MSDEFRLFLQGNTKKCGRLDLTMLHFATCRHKVQFITIHLRYFTLRLSCTLLT